MLHRFEPGHTAVRESRIQIRWWQARLQDSQGRWRPLSVLQDDEGPPAKTLKLRDDPL